MSPADEVAVEANVGEEEVEQDKGNMHIRPAQVHRVKGILVTQVLCLFPRLLNQ